VFSIKSSDGTDLYCRLIRPVNFDSTKKYPVIVYVYGGPHAQLITDTWLWGAGIYLNYLAQQGYLVFTLDNRGSANRGFEFESIIHRNCGKMEVEDQMAGVRYLKTLPYVDIERIGVDGWSYGGFMTINLLLENPGVFKAGCAGGPVCDWKYYEVMYGERYMDTPESNPEGYKASSLIENADKLSDKLMIIHCTTDPVVVWQNSLSFVQKCIENKQLLEYFVYPGHDHNVGGIDRAHLIRKIEDYFKRTL
jgi:dipeptidyl aminopeptidase/acylaminoacyl peptidase